MCVGRGGGWLVGVEGFHFNLFFEGDILGGMGWVGALELQEIVSTLEKIRFFEGGKKFLLGDQASEYDCSIFGFMVQFLWQMPETAEETYMKGKTHSKSFTDNRSILSSP